MLRPAQGLGLGMGALGWAILSVKVLGLQVTLDQVTVASALAVRAVVQQPWHPLGARWKCSVSGSLPDALYQSAFERGPQVAHVHTKVGQPWLNSNVPALTLAEHRLWADTVLRALTQVASPKSRSNLPMLELTIPTLQTRN